MMKCALSKKDKYLTLLEFYHECHSLIGYATHLNVVDTCSEKLNKTAATFLCFQSVCEEDLDKVLND